MHALILAAGEGSRLRADGVQVPKPFVEIGGRPLLVRLVETLRALGCESITAAVRRSVLAAMALPPSAARAAGVRFVWCETPSSLHTLALALEAVPPGPLVCTMVDSVMRDDDWQRLFARADTSLREGADACVAVTAHLDDERPLWVARRPDGSVAAFGEARVDPPLVTGGVYFLSSRIRELAPRVLRLGIARMRGFLGWLVVHGYRVETAEVERIVDLDRGQDIAAAAAWLGAPAPGSSLR
jgi:NDP-sugar pyrophosphorylase family protein